MKANFNIFLNLLLFTLGYAVAMGILVFACINIITTDLPIVLKGLAFIPLIFIGLLLSYSLAELWGNKK